MYNFDPFAAAAICDALGLVVPTGSEATVVLSGFFAEMQEMVAEMLGEFATGTVVLYTETVGNVTGDDPFAEPTISRQAVDVNCVVFGYSSAQNDAGKQVREVEIAMDATDIEAAPLRGHRIKINDVIHILTEVEPVPEVGICCAYFLKAQTAG